jgi:ankyrin repeat protein
MFATGSGSPVPVKILLESGADPNSRTIEGITPVITAAEDTAVLGMLKKYGARIDEADNKGRTALFIAIINDQIDKAEWLLRNGADPNTKNLEGDTPLRFLRTLENTEKRRKIAEMLKRYGGKP